MPVPQIDQIRNLGDYATVYHWSFEVATSPTVVGFDDGLNLRCTTSDVPKMSSEPILIDVRGVKIKQHGIYTPTQQITIELNETVDNYVHSRIKQWRDACWAARTGAQKTMEEVKGDFLLHRYDGTREKIIWTYKLVGVFLEDYDIPQLNNASEALKPTMILSYDYFLDGEGAAPN